MKKKAVVGTAAALGMALLFYAQGARAAALASDSGSSYQNPWGPGNPQNQASTGFAPWVFDLFNPPTNNPPTSPFFIDTTRGAWGINVVGDIVSGMPGYDAAWRSFTGDGHLDPGQTFSTTVLYTRPGLIARQRNRLRALTSSLKTPRCQADMTVLVTRF